MTNYESPAEVFARIQPEFCDPDPDCVDCNGAGCIVDDGPWNEYPEEYNCHCIERHRHA